MPGDPKLPFDPEAGDPFASSYASSAKVHAKADAIDARELQIAEYVSAKRDAWIKTNTVASPFAQTQVVEPSAQHIQTWRDEAAAKAQKEQGT